MADVDWQAAYVLHRRHYQETSVILTLLTDTQGMLSAVAKGARRPKHRWYSALQPFMPLTIQTRGRFELQTLTQADPTEFLPPLTGNALICALYLNELCVRILPPTGDLHTTIFAHYAHCLRQLRFANSNPKLLEISLREFEFALLADLGYAIDFSGVDSSKSYYYDSTQGWKLPVPAEANQRLFLPDIRNAIAQQAWDFPQALTAAKHLTRLALGPLLGSRPLKTRALWR